MAETTPTLPKEHVFLATPNQEYGAIVSNRRREDKPLQQVREKSPPCDAPEANSEQNENNTGNEAAVEAVPVIEQSSRLLNLLGEIRNKIWRLHLVHCPANDMKRCKVTSTRRRQPKLLRTCRQNREEGESKRRNLYLATEIVLAMQGVPWSVVENILTNFKADIESRVRISERQEQHVFYTAREVAKQIASIKADTSQGF